jgi:methylated-DNA-[protein]-cysteine S-methyltransferase
MFTRQGDGTGRGHECLGPAVARFETGWGEGSVTVDSGRLVAVDLPSPGRSVARETPAESMAAEDREALARWVAELEAYFHGERLGWTTAEVPLEELGVPSFDRRVYEALLSIPPGATVGYGTLAELAGFPRAARAVGSAMASNPIPIVIPCHRVIYADGRLGHYGNDDAWKERLLAHEERHVGRAGGGEGRE